MLRRTRAGGWSDDCVLAKVRDIVLPAIERNGAIEAWLIDDTGFPKKGKHSVGVTRQCGRHPAAHDGVASRPRTASAEGLDGAGSTAEPDAPG